MELSPKVSAKSLAAAVGVVDGGEQRNSGVGHVFDLRNQLRIIESREDFFRIQIYSEVAAKYLPALVSIFRKKTDLLGCETTLMNMICTTPYFLRFLRTFGGQGLAALQASRVARAAPDIASMEVDDVGEIGQFLSTILLLQGIEDVATADRSVLLQHLPIWEQKFRGTLAAETARRCLALFTNDPTMRQTMESVKKVLEDEVNNCGGPGCVRNVQEDGSALFHCGRCRSAVYVSVISVNLNYVNAN